MRGTGNGDDWQEIVRMRQVQVGAEIRRGQDRLVGWQEQPRCEVYGRVAGGCGRCLSRSDPSRMSRMVLVLDPPNNRTQRTPR